MNRKGIRVDQIDQKREIFLSSNYARTAQKKQKTFAVMIRRNEFRMESF